MDISNYLKMFDNCECGKAHSVDIKAVEIGTGMKDKCPKILAENSFPDDLLVVTDKNALNASGNILDVLKDGGFTYELKLYNDIRVADRLLSEEIAALAEKHKGILSIGSGSCNDVCRRAALLADKEFAIFATAPSMDGFASGTSSITDGGFKATLPARQPSIIIADTEILMNAPDELKAAGFGDVMAKYVALVDWRVSDLLTGEYYCERIAQMVRNLLNRLVKMAEKVTEKDQQTAGAIMEALVLSGLLMKLADSVRPASGTEHIVSHFWEIKKLEKGMLSDFHGRKVGVATIFISRIYYEMISRKKPEFHEDTTDWDKVYEAYGRNLSPYVKKLNNPPVTSRVRAEDLRNKWQEICKIVREELPEPEQLESIMRKAGATVSLKDIDVDKDLGILGLQYHPYMRDRLTLMRLLPMTNIKIDFAAVADGCEK